MVRMLLFIMVRSDCGGMLSFVCLCFLVLVFDRREVLGVGDGCEDEYRISGMQFAMRGFEGVACHQRSVIS